jgi:dihydroorotate dehydrogenase (NAD+) catalytic subunit
MGGIAEAKDAVEFMLAGATAAQIGTANFADPFVWNKVLDGLEDYMRRHDIVRAADLIGAVDTSPRQPVHA